MLHHVSLEVLPSDAERFAALLEAIGFERVAAPEVLGDAVLWFGRQGTQVHLIVTEGAIAPMLGHSAFAVDDFDEAVAAVRALGLRFEESRELWGERRGFVLAPSGHRMELMAAPPP
jgi:catechol 2,3-dioxygenase-like lactoylglutathione lyase family enzyme